MVGHGLRTTHHIVAVGGVGTDGGNAEEVKEFLEKAVLVGVKKILCGHAGKVARPPQLDNAGYAGPQKTSGADPSWIRPALVQVLEKVGPWAQTVAEKMTRPFWSVKSAASTLDPMGIVDTNWW